jgi:CRISPR/Cas system-associated exonuclease Cas4 (RecB family)
VTFISKTDYVLWRACPKNAWLRIHRPEIYYTKELTEFEQSVIDMGNEVEAVARGLFPEGVLVPGTKEEARENTPRYLANNTATLFQAVFEREQLLAAVDVLERNGDTRDYSIFEIKSSTRTEKEHLYDLAFQVLLLRLSGLSVRQASIIHLNPHYVRQGDLDIQQLFEIVDLTAGVESQAETVSREIAEAKSYLLKEAEPAGPCSCIYKPRAKHCTTFEYSNPNIPRYGVHDIARIGSSLKKLKDLVDKGIYELAEVPEDLKLTGVQNAQLQAYRTGETVIDKQAICSELEDLSYPLHFIDYETFAPAIPRYCEYCPYDQIPLQYSVHIVGAPGEEPIHRDFLYAGTDDPSTAFFCSLQQHIASFGTIIVWNQGFESHVNDSIARRLPFTKDYFVAFNDRLYDLMNIFAKQYFVHKDLCGKVSIKNVLPVLTPHLSYSPLEIHDGAAASLVWSKLISGYLTGEERDRLYGHLREYCALDSYGMYAIWEALTRLVADSVQTPLS